MGRTVFARGALLLLPAVVSVLLSGAARGEERALSLPQVMEYALEHNGELASLREEGGIREAGKVRAGLLPNPTLDLEGATGALTGSSAENSVAIGVSQEFLLAGKRGKRLAIAGREMELYRWQLAERQRLLSAEVKDAFYDALLARERVALAERSIELSRQLLDVTRERLAAGDIPELEMGLAKVEVARSEGARVEAAKALLQSEAKLQTLMGAPAGERPTLSGKLDALSPMTSSLASLKELARGNRPDLKALEAEKGRGEAEAALARAEGIPNLTAGVVVRRDTTTMEIGGVEGKDTAYTVGLRLSMPIPVFDRNRAGIQEARARRMSSETRLAALLPALEREVEAAYASFQHAESVLSLYKAEILPQLEENLRLTQEAYRLGEVGILAVIQEQKKFTEVGDGYLTSLHDRQTALAKLEAAAAAALTGGEK